MKYKTKIKMFKCSNCQSYKDYLNICFVSNKGYSIGCSYEVFNKVLRDDQLYFENIKLLEKSLLFKFFKKILETPLKIESHSDATSCKQVFKSFSEQDIKRFVSDNVWDNVVKNFDLTYLNEADALFNPKYIKKVNVSKFIDYLEDRQVHLSSICEIKGKNLTPQEIEEFCTFTIESFYNRHTNHYSISDVKRFKTDQAVFFDLPYKYIYHKLNNKIVGYLILCEIEQHPLFNEKVFHIGYWGIDESVSRNDKNIIKKSWANLLVKINREVSIVANIDYFNKSAELLTNKFNFKTYGVRLDPRV